MYKPLFSQTFDNLGDKLPFQAHSHHFWPDIAMEGMEQYWKDSTNLIDEKWEKIFSIIIPTAQELVAKMLNVESHKQIVFGNNTHELVYRFLSSFKDENLKILTTDSEFYSLSRQLNRLKEDKIEIDSLIIEDGASGAIIEQIIKRVQRYKPNVLVFSQCFFNSGYYITEQDLELLLNSIDPNIEVLIDGYHSFATRPIDLKNICKRAYFTSGGYKYAMGGEGVCFLVTPLDTQLRPRFTGWMAEIEKLDNMDSSKVYYPKGASRFLGSTFDPSGLYRFIAVWKHLDQKSITTQVIHEYVLSLQNQFLKHFHSSTTFKGCQLQLVDMNNHAHFFAIDCKSHQRALEIFDLLKDKLILCDKRKSVIRFGFSIYQDSSDIDELFARLSS